MIGAQHLGFKKTKQKIKKNNKRNPKGFILLVQQKGNNPCHRSGDILYLIR